MVIFLISDECSFDTYDFKIRKVVKFEHVYIFSFLFLEKSNIAKNL